MSLVPTKRLFKCRSAARLTGSPLDVRLLTGPGGEAMLQELFTIQKRNRRTLVSRFYHIENKLDAIVNYLAREVPLAP
jgi:hypothetical protein